MKMNKILLVAFSCFFLIIRINSPLRAEPLKIVSIDWCPQLCPESEYDGYVIDTVKMIFKKSPYELKIKTYPWSRAIKLVRDGKAHAILSPARMEAPDLLFPENEIGIQKMCFFTKMESKWEYSGIESLGNLKIGIAYDTSIEELNSYIAQNSDQFDFMPYNGTYIVNSLKKLDAGRFDTFLFTHNTTLYEMKMLGMENKYRLAGCVSSAKIYMAFSPEKSQTSRVERMIKYFDKKIAELKRGNKITQIMRRYDLEDWQEIK